MAAAAIRPAPRPVDGGRGCAQSHCPLRLPPCHGDTGRPSHPPCARKHPTSTQKQSAAGPREKRGALSAGWAGGWARGPRPMPPASPVCTGQEASVTVSQHMGQSVTVPPGVPARCARQPGVPVSQVCTVTGGPVGCRRLGGKQLLASGLSEASGWPAPCPPALRDTARILPSWNFCSGRCCTKELFLPATRGSARTRSPQPRSALAR